MLLKVSQTSGRSKAADKGFWRAKLSPRNLLLHRVCTSASGSALTKAPAEFNMFPTLDI